MAQYKVAEYSLIYEGFESQGLKAQFIADLKESLYFEVEEIDWHPALTIVVDVVDGSIKGRVTFFASVMLILNGLSNYGGIRDGIGYITEDAKWVFNQIEERVNRQTQFQSRYLRKKIDFGIVQEIHEIIAEIEDIERNYDSRSSIENKVKLRSLKQKLSNILGSMDRDDSRILLRGLPDSITRSLPEPEDSETYEWFNRFGLRSEDEPKIVRKGK